MDIRLYSLSEEEIQEIEQAADNLLGLCDKAGADVVLRIVTSVKESGDEYVEEETIVGAIVDEGSSEIQTVISGLANQTATLKRTSDVSTIESTRLGIVSPGDGKVH